VRLVAIHHIISLSKFVILGLIQNPVFFWIPAFTGMTPFAVINVAVYRISKLGFARNRPLSLGSLEETVLPCFLFVNKKSLRLLKKFLIVVRSILSC
jgi:hypothetical protein